MATNRTVQSGENVKGADFSRLPEGDQTAVLRDLFGTGSEWSFLTEIMGAEPERKIAMLRALKSLTQAQLAKLANVRQADVSTAERSVDSVKLGVLRRIADGLHVPLKKILFFALL